MTLTIRPATPADLPLIAQFIRDIGLAYLGSGLILLDAAAKPIL